MDSEQFPTACPHCQGQDLYTTKVSAGGGHGPYFLPGLGGFLYMAEFDVVVCSACGLTRFFATKDACRKLESSGRWHKVGSTLS